jgi:multimeric flavodoxin WrbA
MRILLLNGNPDPGNTGWESYLDSFVEEKERSGATVVRRELRDLDIRFCTGCWSCWYKTPGLCMHKDDMSGLYPEILAADLTVWASPLIMGNVSALIKKTQDRFIPLLHPFFEMDHGELHHRRRYPKNIDMGLIVEAGPDDTEEDLRIVRFLHERLARNGRGRLVFFDAMARASKEAVHETIGA